MNWVSKRWEMDWEEWKRGCEMVKRRWELGRERILRRGGDVGLDGKVG